MKGNPHEPPQVPLDDQQRRDQALISQAHAEAAQSWRAALDKAMGDQQLRKWCIEQANVFCEHNENTGMQPFALDYVARGILRFIGEPFSEVIAKK